MEAVRVENLHLSYVPGQPVLDGVNFEVECGETVVIAGLSGCGKSSLCHVLCGIIPQLIEGDVSGQMELDGENIAGKSVAELALIVALVMQDSDNQLFCTTLEDELAFGLENRCVEPEEISHSIDMMLERTKLSRYRYSDPGQLSGGEKKRAALAAATMGEPSIVILDEPLSGLDEAGRQLVGEMLRELHEQQVTVLIVEHDLTAVTARLADRWLILDQGRVVAHDTPDKLRHNQILYELELL
ncbi:MAG TPA: ABC transporter ATP-binding protein [Clostridiales bacterium]|jgi:energy-coupling factor transporter ATP-binding protein EcfA2|nr:ABC transporter ATP-binding protein [Clostridiales bacterium]